MGTLNDKRTTLQTACLTACLATGFGMQAAPPADAQLLTSTGVEVFGACFSYFSPGTTQGETIVAPVSGSRPLTSANYDVVIFNHSELVGQEWSAVFPGIDEASVARDVANGIIAPNQPLLSGFLGELDSNYSNSTLPGQTQFSAVAVEFSGGKNIGTALLTGVPGQANGTFSAFGFVPAAPPANVPEPGEVAGLLCGMGVFGGLLSRRRQRRVAQTKV